MKDGAKVFLGVGGIGAALTIWLLTRPRFDVCEYDTDGDGLISLQETLYAIKDGVDGLLTEVQVQRVVDCYYSKEDCSVC